MCYITQWHFTHGWDVWPGYPGPAWGQLNEACLCRSESSLTITSYWWCSVHAHEGYGTLSVCVCVCVCVLPIYKLIKTFMQQIELISGLYANFSRFSTYSFSIKLSLELLHFCSFLNAKSAICTPCTVNCIWKSMYTNPWHNFFVYNIKRTLFTVARALLELHVACTVLASVHSKMSAVDL